MDAAALSGAMACAGWRWGSLATDGWTDADIDCHHVALDVVQNGFLCFRD